MKIKAMKNGPYLLEVTEANVIREGVIESLSQKTIALCRCGQSSKKPLCDGSHKKCEFNGGEAEIEFS